MPFTHDEPIYNPEGTVKPGMPPEPVEKTQQQTEKNVPSALDNKLESLVNGTAEAKVMGRLALDPEFRKVMEARQAGKKAKVVFEDDVPETVQQAPEPAVDWDQLSNSQLVEKLPSKILGPIEKMLKSHTEAVVAPLRAEIEMLRGATQQNQQEKAQAQIAQAVKEFPDFDSYRNEMIRLNQSNPGLDVKELYYLARVRSGKPLVDPKPTQTERPTSSSARPPLSQRENFKMKPGVRGMSDLLDRALKDKDFSMQSMDEE